MEKLSKLQEILSRYDSAVIAFSGGVDSTFLARIAADVTGNNVLLVTASSSTYPVRELEESRKLALSLNMKHRVIVSEELDIAGFSENNPDRCYYCKLELFRKITQIASEEGYAVVFDGSNADDVHDYRPGRRALRELGIISPLCEAGFTKQEIRDISAKMGLSTASKPSFACLASRFPYGEKITGDKLSRVGKAEDSLIKLGFHQFRVRSHGDLARIEIESSQMDMAWAMRGEMERVCREAGFTFAALDLRGYRTGAMNEALNQAGNIQPGAAD
ncbi:MAG: ATP-dependent sacrificial sulfur transferase LarE [Fibrobacter sp.]|nr:ATP-dependent sacrificial sulfur transferase LarE [Fibrobacter sp.]